MTTEDKISLIKARGYKVDCQLDKYFVVLNPSDADFYLHGSEAILDKALELGPAS